MKWVVSVGVLALAALAVQAGPSVTKACVANASWKENCNDCICSEAGQPMCTKRVCPEPAPLPNTECTPGTVWRQSCNSCRCTATGLSICTQMACLGDLPPSAALPQPMPDHTRPAECREGRTWKEGCNTCSCLGGRKACTLMACLNLGASAAGTGLESPSLLPAPIHETPSVLPAPIHETPSVLPAPIHETPSVLPAPIHETPSVLPAPLTSQDCVPGETWKEDCNSCRCLPSRQAACTMARCISKRAVDGPEPSLAAAPAPAQAPGAKRRSCTVGEVWKDDCKGGVRVARAAQYQTFPPQGHRGPGQVGCLSGSTWKQDCNTCHCINGREVCTFALCVDQGQGQQGQ